MTGSIRSITRDDGTIEMLEVVDRKDFVCDFCGDPPTCEFPCEDFTIKVFPGPELTSEGAWCACNACADLIDAGNMPALTQRAIAKVEEREGVKVPPLVKLIMSKQHRRFAELHGPRQAIA